MQLDEFFNYKNRLMKEICSDKEIVELITNNENVSVPDLGLRYTNVFPYEFLPETVEDASTFICFDIDIASVQNKTFYNPVLYVWIFTHKSLIRTNSGGARTDELALAINKKINGSRTFGLGTTELKSVERFAPAPNYQGRVLTYCMRDFNRAGMNSKPPAKRGL